MIKTEKEPNVIKNKNAINIFNISSTWLTFRKIQHRRGISQKDISGGRFEKELQSGTIIIIKRIEISKISNTGEEFHRKNISDARFEKKSWSHKVEGSTVLVGPHCPNLLWTHENTSLISYNSRVLHIQYMRLRGYIWDAPLVSY